MLTRALPLVGVVAVALGATVEKRELVDFRDPKAWAAAECTIEPSRGPTAGGPATWHWHVDVDYFAGEAKYPVGWPRISHSFPEADRDWSQWEFLHFWVYVETSRAALPKDPAGLGLSTPDRAGAYSRPLGELQPGRWIELNLPLSEIPRHHDVRQIQFNISESNYRHGDRLDFFLRDLELTRYAEPTLFGFTAENTVLFSDARRLPVHFELLGVKPDARASVRCELQRDGKVVAGTTCEAGRGAQRAMLEFGAAKLTSGNYEMHAGIAGRPLSAVASVRVVESPWP
jgi:hypothetical protein